MSEPFDAAGLLPLRWPDNFTLHDAGVAKLVYAPGSKSGEVHSSCRFESDLRHQTSLISFINWRIRINRVQTASQMLIFRRSAPVHPWPCLDSLLRRVRSAESVSCLRDP